MTPRALSIRLACYLGALFTTMGVVLPFWPLFLETRGLSATEIGIVLAAGSWMKVISVPLWGRVADPPGRGRPTLIGLALASAAAYAAFILAEGFVAVLALTLAMNFVFNALFPLGDAQVVQATREMGVDYGRIRLWGSATFILGNLVGGALIGLTQEAWFLAAVVLPLLVTSGTAWSLPRRPPDRSPQARPRVLSLLQDRRFLALVLTAGTVQASHGAFYSVTSLSWSAAGLSDQTIAWLWIEGVVAEILLLAFGKHLLRRTPPYRLMALAGAAGMLRWGLTAATADLAVLAVAQALHAFTYAATQLAAVTLIGRCVPAGLIASGQSLYVTLQSGVMMSAAMALSGWLYDLSGPALPHAVMAGFSAAGLAFALLLRRPLSLVPEPPRYSVP